MDYESVSLLLWITNPWVSYRLRVEIILEKNEKVLDVKKNLDAREIPQYVSNKTVCVIIFSGPSLFRCFLFLFG